MQIFVGGASTKLGGRERGRRFHVDELAVAEGASACILGPTGAGKSTLLHLVTGMLVADRGIVSVGEVEWASLSSRERDRFRRQHVAHVFQTLNLLNMLTARENIALPLVLRGVARGDAFAQARAWLDRLQLAHRANNIATTLSVGEQQRVAVARALAAKPAVLVADEPTASLDAQHRERLLDEIFAYTEELGVTLLVVTHDDRVAVRFDDRRHIREIVRWGSL